MVALSGALYGTIYAYERLTWTNQVISFTLFDWRIQCIHVFFILDTWQFYTCLCYRPRPCIQNCPGEVERVQASVCWSRGQETAVDCWYDQRQLQPPGSCPWLNCFYICISLKLGSARALLNFRKAVPPGGRVNCRDEGGGEVFGEGGQAVGGDRRQEQGVPILLEMFQNLLRC